MLLAQLLLPLGMPSSFLDQLLEDQSDLTAVERFSKSHDALEQSGQPVLEKHYRDLIPKDPLRPGQQYAFEVNLDACTGCKACVVGCHHMNGLDETETWRKVDLLKGADPEPTVQHLTSACHHCIDPGCMTGCPVQAYEKDETTGVVAHLDDQCIGCRYCELKCPYEVPQYSESLGIVRKCDMCIGRLQEGEAPACVQSCPTKRLKSRLSKKIVS
jgi:Fe-S-cluster-containing dehydrogenase component